MNKGLELIEAYHLFPVEAEQLDVHRASAVHRALPRDLPRRVHAGATCLPRHADADRPVVWPGLPAWQRRPSGSTSSKIGQLSFEAPDEARFPALKVAKDAMRRGGTAPAVMNAANEIAVEAFLNKRIGFLDIARTVRETLDRAEGNGLLTKARTLADVLEVDGEARALARASL